MAHPRGVPPPRSGESSGRVRENGTCQEPVTHRDNRVRVVSWLYSPEEGRIFANTEYRSRREKGYPPLQYMRRSNRTPFRCSTSGCMSGCKFRSGFLEQILGDWVGSRVAHTVALFGGHRSRLVSPMQARFSCSTRVPPSVFRSLNTVTGERVLTCFKIG